MADRSKRNEKERQDRAELAAYRKVTSDMLSISVPTPEELRSHLLWCQRVCRFVETIGTRSKPYFKPGELPK